MTDPKQTEHRGLPLHLRQLYSADSGRLRRDFQQCRRIKFKFLIPFTETKVNDVFTAAGTWSA